MTFSPFDIYCMSRALALARRGQGKVEPNPMVGAVVVSNHKVIGEGYHQQFGGPHAEVHALHAAGRRAKGATLYVTLEPCCHFGKTPPCTDAILAAGIRRVVVAMTDPFPKVHGRGAKILRAHGIKVEIGLLENQARELNAPFITRLTQNRPYIIAKWAQSLDGRVALAPLPGSKTPRPAWISSDISREKVHKLRARMDAILIGINTALIDDPLLTARPTRPADALRTPTRIILDSDCRLPLASKLVRTIPEAPLLIAHLANLTPAATRRKNALAAKGAMTLALPADRTGHPSIPALLRHLAKLDYTNLLLEGGPTLLSSFLDQNLIDEAHIYLAPILIGGTAPTALAGPNITKLAIAPRLRLISATHSGPDLHLVYRRA